jgi:hypothetical protein
MLARKRQRLADAATARELLAAWPLAAPGRERQPRAEVRRARRQPGPHMQAPAGRVVVSLRLGGFGIPGRLWRLGCVRRLGQFCRSGLRR